MVMRVKLHRVIDAYRSLLITKAKRHLTLPGKKSFGIKQLRQGNRKKNKILNFFLATGRWPKRTADSKRERLLGTCFENFIAKESPSYDSNLRRIARSTGRGTNNKRKHDVAGFKQQIIEFMKEYGRVPTTHAGETIEGEGTLRSKLDYYTKQMNDMTLLGTIYKYDKCHLSGIPVKYRRILNEQLDLEKPLIRMI